MKRLEALCKWASMLINNAFSAQPVGIQPHAEWITAAENWKKEWKLLRAEKEAAIAEIQAIRDKWGLD